MIKIGDYEITRIEEVLLVEQPTTHAPQVRGMVWGNSAISDLILGSSGAIARERLEGWPHARRRP